MSIQLPGIGSGSSIDSMIQQLVAPDQQPIDLLNQQKSDIQSQQSEYSTVSSQISGLSGAISTLTDANLSSGLDIFSSKSATSSDTDALTVSATNDATMGNFSVNILNLATPTQATSLAPVGEYTTGSSPLNAIAQGAVTSGSFTMYVNNQAVTINVDASNETMQDILNKMTTQIANITGQPASATLTSDGKIQFNTAAGTQLNFGASGDTSNFSQITSLTTGSANANQSTYTSQYGTSCINLNGTLVGNGAGLANNTITPGTFNINGASFTVDAKTTLNSLINQINASSQAGVTISYDPTSNKFEMISKSTGQQAISLDDGGTGFLSALGLVNGTNTLSSQTLGQNAQFQVNNGTILSSPSNTVNDSITGLSGVTLNLLAPTTNGSAATVSVAQDQSQLSNALSNFVSKFNAVISTISQQTGKGGTLNSDSNLILLRSQLLSIVGGASSNPNLTNFKTLSQVGISSGSSTDSSGSAPSLSLSLDPTQLAAALQNNPTEVQQLLVGDGTTPGLLSQLNNAVNNALDPQWGIFAAENNSTNAQIKNIDDAISRDQESLTNKEDLLRQQFQAMDSLMSQFQSQQNALNSLSLLGTDSSTTNSSQPSLF